MLVPLLTIAARSVHFPASAGRLHKQSFLDRAVWRVR